MKDKIIAIVVVVLVILTCISTYCNYNQRNTILGLKKQVEVLETKLKLSKLEQGV